MASMGHIRSLLQMFFQFFSIVDWHKGFSVEAQQQFQSFCGESYATLLLTIIMDVGSRGKWKEGDFITSMAYFCQKLF
jgi:hypothetical protein